MRIRVARWPGAPLVAAAAVALAWVVAAPATADMAAHDFRAWLWEQEGFAVYNAQWYGGHHVPAYSLLFPPLAAAVGPWAAVAIAGLAAAAALVALALAAGGGGRRSLVAAWLLSAGAASNLVVGRGPFALGVALGALAVLLALRGRNGWSAAAAASCAAASPVAGLFLVVAGGGRLLARPRRAASALALAAPAVVVGAALGLLFPEGGAERFVATAFWPMLALCAAATALLAPEHRAMRAAAGIYLVLLTACFVLDTPVGQNALRLGALAGPAVVAFAGRGPRWALVSLTAALLYLQWLPAARAVVEARGDPASEAAFHAPLVDLLRSRAAPGDRLEIPLTRNHWEASHVARHFALARGWERQLDVGRNGLFYAREPLDERTYERWLRREGIRWVALPAAPLDFSAREEARLLRAGLPFLRLVSRGARWQVWEVRGVAPAAGVISAGPTAVRLRAERPGAVVVRRRFTPYWRVDGAGCVRRAAGGWTEVQAARPGLLVLRSAFAIRRGASAGACAS